MRIEKTHSPIFLNTKSIKQISFPNYYSLVRIFFLVFILSISMISCKEKEFTDLAVQPDQDKLGISFISNSDIISYILSERDSTRTDETELNLLGSYKDPIMGKCEASFTSQFQLQSTNPAFKWRDSTNALRLPVIDSVVLSLVYSDTYGDVGKLRGLQQVKVYELIQDTYDTSEYASNKNMDSYYNVLQPLATKKFWPQQSPQLRIHLDTVTFAKKIMGFLNLADSVNFSSNTLFKLFFKGLYITTDNSFQSENQGGIISFNLLNSSSKITTYYHDTISKSFDYVISEGCARINLFKHNYASAPQIQNQLLNPALGQQQIYVQAMAGLKSKIEIPFLKQLMDSTPIAINKAEIIFKIDEPFTGKYVPNNRLFLFGIDSTGTRVFLPDQTESAAFSGQYYGGFYDPANQQYRFNIARYVQLVVTKKITDRGLYLVTGSTHITANRVVLKGGKNIQFNLTYTKL